MLQATALRLKGLEDVPDIALAPALLIGNEEYRFLIAEQMRQLGIRHAPLILEPCGRNTAPAVTLAALAAQLEGQDPVMIIMPADHIILDDRAFQDAVCQGARLAEQGKLVTFGIEPSCPETGYGYIRQGQLIEGSARVVAQFVEKPDRATAESYLASGDFLWNGGIFAIKASVWLAKIEQCRPDIGFACLQAFTGRQSDGDFLRPAAQPFEQCPADSIDYAVMEKLAAADKNSGEVAVVPLSARWSDVGAWDALWAIWDKDDAGNALEGDIVAIETTNTLAISESRLVACIGLDNLVVVETPDAVLVADKRHIQKVKDVVNQLKATQRPETNTHRKVFRPWGSYDGIDAGGRFQVKRIVVNPGASLSLQMHHHRAEHWIVVSGTALVTKGEESFLVSENESTYIPLGTVHRLSNPGKLPLEMIEVQSGSYLGEDDIVRFDDKYGR